MCQQSGKDLEERRFIITATFSGFSPVAHGTELQMHQPNKARALFILEGFVTVVIKEALGNDSLKSDLRGREGIPSQTQPQCPLPMGCSRCPLADTAPPRSRSERSVCTAHQSPTTCLGGGGPNKQNLLNQFEADGLRAAFFPLFCLLVCLCT